MKETQGMFGTEKLSFYKKEQQQRQPEKPETKPVFPKGEQERIDAIRVELAEFPILALVVPSAGEKHLKNKPDSITEKIIDLIIDIFNKITSTAAGNKLSQH
jgi:hypothetical protein